MVLLPTAPAPVAIARNHRNPRRVRVHVFFALEVALARALCHRAQIAGRNRAHIRPLVDGIELRIAVAGAKAHRVPAQRPHRIRRRLDNAAYDALSRSEGAHQ